MIKLRGILMILELHRQGLSVSAIAERTGTDRKTVRKYIARGLEAPSYGPRAPRKTQLEPYEQYLRERVQAFPSLTGRRLLRELRERGYEGCYSAVTEFLREVRPAPNPGFEVRFETPPGKQAQVDFAQFKTVFEDDPSEQRIVWLFSMVLGFSRWMWARFVTHQDLQTVLRCHMAAFEAMGGTPAEILYDRMKTAVLDEDEGGIAYNRKLIDLAGHYGFEPRACRPYRPQTKGKVERPYRYVREDFFLASSFRNLEDLNTQLAQWLERVANPRLHATTQRVVNDAFAEERSLLRPLPGPYTSVLKLERRVSREGMVSVGGNQYSVPDCTRKRVVEVHSLAREIQIFEEGRLIAVHPVLEGHHGRAIAAGHRRQPPPVNSRTPRIGEPVVIGRAGEQVAQRPLEFYAAVGRQLAGGGV